MEDGKDFDRVRVHSIDQAVRPLDQLANLRAIEFCDDAPRFGELARLIETTSDAINEVLGVDWGG